MSNENIRFNRLKMVTEHMARRLSETFPELAQEAKDAVEETGKLDPDAAMCTEHFPLTRLRAKAKPLIAKLAEERRIKEEKERLLSARRRSPIEGLKSTKNEAEVLTFEETYVTKSEYAERQDVCNSCEFLSGTVCVKFKKSGCGCGGDLHGSRRRDVECPVGKW